MPATRKASGTNKTYADRLKFGDKDLENPLHDDIMRWLDANIVPVVRSLGPDRWAPERIAQLRVYAQEAVAKALPEVEATAERLRQKGNPDEWWEPKLRELRAFAGLSDDVPARPEVDVRINDKKWEYSITPPRKRDTIVGFADMMVTCEVASLEVGRVSVYDGRASLDTNSYEPEGKFAPYWEIEYHRKTFFFEAKTTYRLGELVRQINYYKETLDPYNPENTGRWVLVCPDDRDVELLKQQRIEFVKYEPNPQQRRLVE